jgi:DNA-binding MarR family transcriptional regulator
MTLANLLKRGAGVRYRRLLGLPQGEWGVIAQLGARAPRTLGDLAAGMGLDITQISRSVSDLVERGLVTRSPNPLNNREVLIALSRKGEAANAVIVDAGFRVNETLLEGLSDRERTALEALLVLFTERAERLLASEQEMSDSAIGGSGASGSRDPRLASGKL